MQYISLAERQLPQSHNLGLGAFDVWLSLADFYRARPARESSTQVDFPGIQDRWIDSSGWSWIVYFLPSTLELAAQRVDYSVVDSPEVHRDDAGPIVLLGSLPPVPLAIGTSALLAPTWPLYASRPPREEWAVSLADVTMLNSRQLVRRGDFMYVIRDRITMLDALLTSMFLDPDTSLYSFVNAAVALRLQTGETRLVREAAGAAPEEAREHGSAQDPRAAPALSIEKENPNSGS